MCKKGPASLHIAPSQIVHETKSPSKKKGFRQKQHAEVPAMDFRTNESRTDRTIRIVGGIVLLALGLVFGSWWGLVGLIPLMTGLAGWCPIYALFGFTTLRVHRTKMHAGTGAL